MDRLNFLLSKINQHLAEIEERSKEKPKTLKDFDALAMSCLQLVNRLIDLGKLLVMEKHLGFPETYSDIFKILKANEIITKEDYETVVKLIYLRNLISHEYSTISDEDLLKFRELSEKVKQIVEKLKTSFS